MLSSCSSRSLAKFLVTIIRLIVIPYASLGETQRRAGFRLARHGRGIGARARSTVHHLPLGEGAKAPTRGRAALEFAPVADARRRAPGRAERACFCTVWFWLFITGACTDIGARRFRVGEGGRPPGGGGGGVNGTGASVRGFNPRTAATVMLDGGTAKRVSDAAMQAKACEERAAVAVPEGGAASMAMRLTEPVCRLREGGSA